MGACGSCHGCGSGGDEVAIGVPVGDGVVWTTDGDQTTRAPLDVAFGPKIAQSVHAQPYRVESAEARQRLQRIFQKVEERRIPFWPHLDLTYKCNTDCIHCYCQHLDPSFGGRYDKHDLTTQEVFDLLDQLAECGAFNLTLSGGELFVRKDFFEIAFYASRERHFALTLYSNGTLINERIADRLAELAPVSIEISMQGATAATHDAIVQRPGSFQRVVRAVQLLRERGINVVLKTTIMQPNFQERDDIVRLSNALGARAYRSTLELTPKNDGDTSVQRHQLTDEQIMEYLLSDFPAPLEYQAPVPLEEARTKPTCGTGAIACYISPYGDVYPCIQLLISMGNIRERRFKDIWEAKSPLREKLEKIQTYGDLPDCNTCEYIQVCQRCHGLAYLETGDLTKCYKLVLRLSKAKHEANARVNPALRPPTLVANPALPGEMVVDTRSTNAVSFART